MGLFTTKLIVWNPAKPGPVEELEVWVDTGAGYSWFSRQRLEGLGVRATRSMQFRTIEGRIIERDLAPVFVQVDGAVGGDSVVMGEEGDMEVLGAHTLESLGLAVDPVQKKLVPTVGMALMGRSGGSVRASRVVESVDGEISAGHLTEPFSNEDFKRACPGFGKGTYNAFLWKHRRGNPRSRPEYFELVGKNRFRRIRH
jgi:predicted aspartyl protease